MPPTAGLSRRLLPTASRPRQEPSSVSDAKLDDTGRLGKRCHQAETRSRTLAMSCGWMKSKTLLPMEIVAS